MNYIRPGTPSERLKFAIRQMGREEQSANVFCDKRHDDLLELLRLRLEMQRDFIDEGLALSILQGLQERGIDLLVDFSDGTRAGISLKSQFDINQSGFVRSTKAQITDASTYPNVELYLLLLCPCPHDKGSIEKCRSLQATIAQGKQVRVRLELLNYGIFQPGKQVGVTH